MAHVRRPSVQFYALGKIQTHGLSPTEFGVWHSTECGDAQGIRELEGVVNFWEGQNLGYGAQVIIDKDGNSALCALPGQITWAVQNHNTGAFHIELIGFARFTPKVWFLRRKQLDKLARWMAWLNLEYGVRLTQSVVHGWESHAAHTAEFGGDHYDPGKGFPKKWVLRKARFYRANGWD